MEEWYYIQSDLKCCGDGRHGDTNGINCKYSGETSNHQQKESNIRSYSILFCRESDSAITNICLFVSSSDSLKFLSIHPSFHFQVCLNCSRFFILKHNITFQCRDIYFKNIYLDKYVFSLKVWSVCLWIKHFNIKNLYTYLMYLFSYEILPTNF